MNVEFIEDQAEFEGNIISNSENLINVKSKGDKTEIEGNTFLNFKPKL